MSTDTDVDTDQEDSEVEEVDGDDEGSTTAVEEESSNGKIQPEGCSTATGSRQTLEALLMGMILLGVRRKWPRKSKRT